MAWTDVARRQGAVISYEQFLATGLTRGQIHALRRGGRLESTGAHGVYRVAGAPDTAEGRAWIAVLGARSPLSFASAAQLWDLPVPDDGLIHITRPDRRRLDWPSGVRVHRVRLEPWAVTRHRGLPLTTRLETALDCIATLPRLRARILADRCVQQGVLDRRSVERRLRDQPRRWGNGQLRQLLDVLGDGAAAESERRLHDLLRSRGLTGWLPNYPIRMSGRRLVLDVAFPEARLAIEIDGYAYHSPDDRFQDDRTKQNLLIAAGWRVLRFTWADLELRPAYVIAQIRALLAA